MPELILKKTDAAHPDFLELVALLNKELAIRDGEDFDFYFQFNQLDSIKHVLLAYREDVVVGCGAFKAFSADEAEVKRMFVKPEYRGLRIAEKILFELEAWAKAEGYVRLVLETGMKQPEAIRLYERSGYKRIENYGQYAGIGNSLCFSKSLLLG